LFPELLDHLVTRTYRDARWVHVILDSYGIHDSRRVRPTLAREKGRRLRLHFLSPYCPDDNRITRVGEDLHANVTRNHRCADHRAPGIPR
jgi:transposase